MGDDVYGNDGSAPAQGGTAKSSRTRTAGTHPSRLSPYGEGGKGFDPSGMEDAASLVKSMPHGRGGGLFASKKIEQLMEDRKANSEKRAELKEYSTQMDKAIRTKRRAARNDLKKQQASEDKVRVEYKDQLARQREADSLQLKKIALEKEAQRKEEMVRREDAIRRQTLEYEAQLRQQTELARVEAETQAKILAERRNHDIRLEKLRQDKIEARHTLLEGMKLAGSTVGSGLSYFLGDKKEMLGAVGVISSLALGIYSARTGTNVAGRYIAARLGKPSLVRETSRRRILATSFSPATAVLSLFRNSSKDALAETRNRPRAIFSPPMERRLRRIVQSTANTKANKAPFRNFLLYGRPGTGKTLFAKALAHGSGLDYAILTGGDIAPLGREAVTEIHKVFDWASTTRKGVVLFVDEADAFLKRRSIEVMSEDLRNALNAFLYRTGEQTGSLMVVYASNQPEQFDEAINDRIDEIAHFELPGLDERLRMLNFYMKKYIIKAEPPRRSVIRYILDAMLGMPTVKPITTRGIGDEELSEVARDTEGFSGREMSKLAIAWQAAAYGTEGCVLSATLMSEVLEHFKLQRQQKEIWEDEALISASAA